MKILTYNIHLSTQEKVDIVLANGADVYILPELACPSRVMLPDGYKIEWTGDLDHKGLGIILEAYLVTLELLIGIAPLLLTKS